MKFLNLYKHHKDSTFANSEGYSARKDIINRAFETDENYILLLCGPPASAKTLFLHRILEFRKDVYFEHH